MKCVRSTLNDGAVHADNLVSAPFIAILVEELEISNSTFGSIGQ